MKKILVLLGVFVWLAVTSIASAEMLFQDNFENAPAIASNAFPDSASGDCDPVAQIGTWDIAGSGGGDEDLEYLVQVANYDPPGAQEGDNYLRAGWSAQAYANGYLAGGPTTDDVVFSLWFYARANRTNDGRVFLYDDQGVYLNFIRMGEQGVAGGVAGQISWLDNGSWTNSNIDGGYTADEWHHLVVTTDLTNSGCTISLDDELLATPTLNSASSANIERINVNGWSSGSLPAMFDNITVASVPEPTALCLLALGLASMVITNRGRQSQ